ncbi:hypothetical protein ES707_11014 [subsurface metagenome]
MTDTDLMPFGKHKDTAMANVPAEYLLWFYHNVARQVHTAPVLDYIRENLTVLEKEVAG